MEHTSENLQPAESHSAKDYSSSPLQTAKDGFKLFWQNGGKALPGVLAVTVVLSIVSSAALLLSAVALAAIIFTSLSNSGDSTVAIIYTSLLAQLPLETVDAMRNFTQSGFAGLISAIAGAAALLGNMLVTAICLAFTTVTVVDRKKASFGAVMRLALKRTLPLTAQTLLVIGAVVALFVLPFIILTPLINAKLGISPTIGFILGLYVFALIITLLIFGARVLFASLSMVAANMGPVQSIKHSLHITKGRVWEIAGVIGVITIIVVVIDFALSPVRNAVTSSDIGILAWFVAELVSSTLVSFVGLAFFAERYRQARVATESNTSHKVDYLQNVGLIVVSIVIGLVLSGLQATLWPPKSLEKYYDPATNDGLYQDDLTAPQLDTVPDDSTYYDDIPSTDSDPYDPDSLNTEDYYYR